MRWHCRLPKATVAASARSEVGKGSLVLHFCPSRTHTSHVANVRLQITYLNSVVMPDEESSDAGEEHGDEGASGEDDKDA